MNSPSGRIGRNCQRLALSATWGLALVLISNLAVAQAQDPSRANADQHKATSDDALQERWAKLTEEQAHEITRRHIHGLVRAAHRYLDEHGAFPPPFIENPKLPAEKRLSGFVLLLPYLDAPSWIERGQPCFDRDVVALGRELYESIDLTKAWDAPANLKAAQTVMPAFLAPQQGTFRDKDGYAVTHFAFVRGSSAGYDGAFPGDTKVTIEDITDGTADTLAFGQVVHDVGPWIAEGLPTARQLYLATSDQPGSFGSRDKFGCYFATCDSSPYFILFDKSKPEALQHLATRAGQELVIAGEDYVRLTSPLKLQQSGRN